MWGVFSMLNKGHRNKASPKQLLNVTSFVNYCQKKVQNPSSRVKTQAKITNCRKSLTKKRLQPATTLATEN